MVLPHHALHAGLGRDADINRSWTVCQYILRGVDPYEVSLNVLQSTYGTTHGPDRIRLRHTKMWDMSGYKGNAEETGVIPELGPPMAGYPPSSTLFLVMTIGMLPQHLLLPVMLALNLITLLLLAREIKRHLPAGHVTLAWIIGLLLIWPPTHEIFRTSQYGLLVFWLALVAVRRMDVNPWLAGFLFALSLLKPALCLLFFYIPFVRGQWKVIAPGVAIHGLASLALPLWLGVDPLKLIATWQEIPRYVLQGAYTMQEVLNRLELENTPAGSLIVYGFLLGVLAWVFVNRRKPTADLIDFLCFANLLWAYHERYDFILLVLPLLRLLDTIATEVTEGRSPARLAVPLLLFVFTAMGLTDAAYLTDNALAHVVRWAARGSLALLLAGYALRLPRLADAPARATPLPA